MPELGTLSTIARPEAPRYAIRLDPSVDERTVVSTPGFRPLFPSFEEKTRAVTFWLDIAPKRTYHEHIAHEAVMTTTTGIARQAQSLLPPGEGMIPAAGSSESPAFRLHLHVSTRAKDPRMMATPCVDRIPFALHTPALSASLLSPRAFGRRAMEPGYGARCRPDRPHDEGVAGALAGATTTVGTVSSAFPHPFSRTPRVGRRVP